MALVNFENPNINVIPAKHLYIVDKDGIKQEIKYVKERNWWNFIFSENINITALDEVEKSDVKVKLPHNYLDLFDQSKMNFQAKAIYFIDSEGNAVEFTNEIKKDWVNEYVTSDVFTPDFKPDIPINISDNISEDVGDLVSNAMSYILYPDIPVNVSENLDFIINTVFGAEGLDITLIPIFLVNIDASVSEDLDFTLNDVATDSVSIVLTPV